MDRPSRLGASTGPRDGFDPWSVVQNETDYRGRTVVMIGRLLTRPTAERERFGAEPAAHHALMGRRLMNADIEVADLAKLLSLPAWRKRHELYGVWMATVGSFENLPADVASRCAVIGYLNPQDHRVRADFRERVRACVGEPARTVDAWLSGEPTVVAVDVSLSMDAILQGAWFERFVAPLDSQGVEEVVLVDADVGTRSGQAESPSGYGTTAADTRRCGIRCRDWARGTAGCWW